MDFGKVILRGVLGIFSGISFAYAESVLVLTTDLSSLNINFNSQIEADFYVKNNSPKALPIYFVNTLGSAITQLTGAVSAMPTCENGISINPNTSCILRLQIHGAFVNSSFNLAPKVCYDPAQQSTCSFPSTNQRIAINFSNEFHDAINAPTHLALPQGISVIEYIINNPFSNPDIEEIQLIFPAIYKPLIESASTISCGTGGGCAMFIYNVTNKEVDVPSTATGIIRGIDENGIYTADTTITLWWDGVSITLAPSEHLQYQAYIYGITEAYTNVTSGVSVNGMGTESNLEACNSVGNTCSANYQTDCTLITPESCSIWLHALPDQSSGITFATSTLTETSNNLPITYNLTNYGTYNTNLYAGIDPSVNAPASVYVYDIGNGIGNAAWQPISDSPQGKVNYLTFFNGDLYVGGLFAQAVNEPINNVASWNGVTWQSLTDGGTSSNGTQGEVFSLTPAFDGVLAVGGSFTKAGNQQANNVAWWCLVGFCNDNETPMWQALIDENSPYNNGVNGPVYAVEMDEYLSVLYVGGSFTSAGNTTANNIAYFNGSSCSNHGTWTPLLDVSNGNGTNGTVYSLSYSGTAATSGTMFVGGNYSAAGEIAANNVAYYTFAESPYWFPLVDQNNAYNGTSGPVFSLQWNQQNLNTNVFGNFTQVGNNLSVANVARWERETPEWFALTGTSSPSGTNGSVLTQAILQNTNLTNQVFLGGNFTSANNTPALNVACWDYAANTWCNDLSLDLNATVNSLVIASSFLLTE